MLTRCKNITILSKLDQKEFFTALLFGKVKLDFFAYDHFRDILLI